MPVIDKVERIRALNDAARRGETSRRLMMTAGVAALGPDLQRQVIEALVSFDRFDADNDPYREHDFGAFAVAGRRLFFKIDCYDRSGCFGSPDPADPAVTRRVVTLMLAEEY